MLDAFEGSFCKSARVSTLSILSKLKASVMQHLSSCMRNVKKTNSCKVLTCTCFTELDNDHAIALMDALLTVV